MWVDLIQSVEGLKKKKKMTSLDKEEILPEDHLWTQTEVLTWVLQSTGQPCRFLTWQVTTLHEPIP